MATYTPNYGLHQWAATDSFLRTDFNTDLSKIDTALKNVSQQTDGKCRFVGGFYQGDDTETRTISLGFTPSLVFLETKHGMRTNIQYGDPSGGIFLPDVATPGGAIVEGGFQVRDNADSNTNAGVYTYLYAAFE